jgi:DNA-binding CsgD family transcriptional regulator
MLDAGDPLVLKAGRLELVGELVAGLVEAAIKAAAEGDARLGRRGLAIPAVRKLGAPIVAHVMPLENRTGRSGLPLRAVAAVFVAEDDEVPKLEVDAVSLLYGLTPMEARVFELIVKGHTTKEMAAALSIAQSTLKTHTLRLFDKTGRRRRSELVRLAAQVRRPR